MRDVYLQRFKYTKTKIEGLPPIISQENGDIFQQIHDTSEVSHNHAPRDIPSNTESTYILTTTTRTKNNPKKN